MGPINSGHKSTPNEPLGLERGGHVLLSNHLPRTCPHERPVLGWGVQAWIVLQSSLVKAKANDLDLRKSVLDQCLQQENQHANDLCPAQGQLQEEWKMGRCGFCLHKSFCPGWGRAANIRAAHPSVRG